MQISSCVRSVIVALLVPAFVVVVPGCSLFVPAKQPLTVIPSDEQAEIYVNGDRVGQGRTVVKLKRGKDYAILARVGDRAGTATVGRKISGAGVADIVGGILLLVPFIGVFAPGFWELNPSTISVAVPPPTGISSSTTLGAYERPAANPGRPSTISPPTGGTRLPPQRSGR